MAATKQTARTFTLNTGAKIPAIGLGTWQSKPNEVKLAVEAALKNGYRHVDTAFAYQNEKEVGDGIIASGVPRDQIWLTTKLDNPWHKRVPEAITKPTDYVDLYLMHWPSSTDPDDLKKHYPDWDYVKTWHELQKLVGTGKIVPAVNQIELHPCNPSPKLLDYCKSKGIHATAYSCLGSTDSPLYTNATLLEIAKAKGRTPQQVLLQWGLARDTSVIPKSVSGGRIKANFDLDDWSLTEEEIKKISAIPDRFKVCDGTFLPDGVKVFFGDDE
ncbi:hypothetical protein COL922a_003186 [Colletotrichum nupharicola]|nr:hypothetical protein COL922a_003186 [Colletotrichum nupharicola]